MNDSEGGDPPHVPLFISQDQQVNETLRAMGDAMTRVARLEHAMRDMIYTDLVAARIPAPAPPAARSARHWVARRASTAIAAILTGPQRIAELHPARIGPGLSAAIASIDPIPGYLSRQVLDRLARNLDEPPLRDQPQVPRRGLRLTGQDGAVAQPLYLRIDRHLRLCFDGNSNIVGIERRVGTDWQRIALSAVKDGMGGVDLDLNELERQAGPLSPALWRILRQETTPPDGIPTDQPPY